MVRIASMALLALLAGCALVAHHTLDERYGAADPGRYDEPEASQSISYRKDVQPILDRRCVVCHGCYDAPCQLKLSSWQGVARGASTKKVYDGGRLLEAAPTRLFIDAQNASEWRKRGFHPVLNERSDTQAANRSASVLFRMLDLKQRHPLPEVDVLPASFDFSLDRKQQCTSIEAFDKYERDYPLWGMPFGLPGLSDAERGTLVNWLEQGAPFGGPAPLPASIERQVAEWEQFFNGDSLKEQLTSRYIYEHLFLAHLYFDSDKHFFRLVRSSTPPGQPVHEIATRRPYEDPGVSPVHYRLVPERETLVAKTHMPYALNPARMQRWRELFLAPDYEVDALPSYSRDVAANPFVAFEALPIGGRYLFMLDEAEFTIMGFIKGPVCRGQLALNVIEDRFWVFFVAPKAIAAQAGAEFLARESSNLSLPSAKGSNALILTTWLEYSRRQDRYLQAKSEFMHHEFKSPSKVTLDLVWDGDGRNPNAALTVFRHFNSASVVQGLVGGPPKTAWLISYPLLERIHYLLVAGFDVYGNAGHQLNSRLYMDFLRMEGEFNFLTLLPSDRRDAVRNYWYRGASQSVKDYLYGTKAWFDQDSGIDYRTDDPLHELYGMLAQHQAPVLHHSFDLSKVKDATLRDQLQTLATLRGGSLAFMPEASVLRLDEADGSSRYFSLLRNTGHSNVAHLMDEKKALRPDENTLTVVPGFIGAYPNALFVVPRASLPEFTLAVQGLSSEDEYRALVDSFGIRRTHPRFWTYSDALQDAYAQQNTDDAALLDYNRLENR